MNTIPPWGSHMCGWARDNGRCSWNSQTGCKIASRMQRKRRSQVLYITRRCASCLLGLSPELRTEWLWVSTQKPQKRSGEPMCVSAGQSAAPAEAFALTPGRFDIRTCGFPPGVVGPEEPRDVLPNCAFVPGMEKKSGSEPRRNGEQQPPWSLPVPFHLGAGVSRNTRAVFASSLEGGGRPWEGRTGRSRNGDLGDPVAGGRGFVGRAVSGQNSASWEPRRWKLRTSDRFTQQS